MRRFVFSRIQSENPEAAAASGVWGDFRLSLSSLTHRQTLTASVTSCKRHVVVYDWRLQSKHTDKRAAAFFFFKDTSKPQRKWNVSRTTGKETGLLSEARTGHPDGRTESSSQGVFSFIRYQGEEVAPVGSILLNFLFWLIWSEGKFSDSFQAPDPLFIWGRHQRTNEKTSNQLNYPFIIQWHEKKTLSFCFFFCFRKSCQE